MKSQVRNESVIKHELFFAKKQNKVRLIAKLEKELAYISDDLKMVNNPIEEINQNTFGSNKDDKAAFLFYNS